MSKPRIVFSPPDKESVEKRNERIAIGFDKLRLQIECKNVSPVTQPFVPEIVPDTQGRANHFEIAAQKSS